MRFVKERMGAEPRIFGFAGNAHCGHGFAADRWCYLLSVPGRQSFFGAPTSFTAPIGAVFALAAGTHITMMLARKPGPILQYHADYDIYLATYCRHCCAPPCWKQYAPKKIKKYSQYLESVSALPYRRCRHVCHFMRQNGFDFIAGHVGRNRPVLTAMSGCLAWSRRLQRH